MKAISEKIYEAVAAAQPKLLEMSPELVRQKINRETWSKQEILGHLLDSALNNHQRFVRGGQNVAEDFPPYNQTGWVEVQHYNEMNWVDLVNLFAQYNFHLCRVIYFLPEAALTNRCNIGKEAPVTLGFVIEDYLRHLKLHLGQILEP